jgi:hypothetical protein
MLREYSRLLARASLMAPWSDGWGLSMSNLGRTVSVAGERVSALASEKSAPCRTRVSSGLLPAVAVMEAAQAWERNHVRFRIWSILHRAPIRIWLGHRESGPHDNNE